MIAGGCFLNKISIGFGEDTQSWLLLHTWFEQHSGSSQSTRPSTRVYYEIVFNFLNTLLPLSLSLPSLQFCSNKMLQSGPSHPLSHLHSHILSELNLHWPCAEQLLGHPSIVQCLPFHPVTQRHVPFLHCPCSLHLGSHCLRLQNSPDQPGSHWQASDTQWPWFPQSKSHSSIIKF